MSPYSLCEQPTEIVDQISSFVDSPKDLLSFSLTSKRVCEVVIPSHIQCRHLRCDFRRLSLWRKLVEYPAIAARFVSVEIVDEESGEDSWIILPSEQALPFYVASEEVKLGSDWLDREDVESDAEAIAIMKPAIIGCLQALAAVLRSMPCLLRFHWHYPLPATNDVFAGLLSCPRLSDVEVTQWDADLYPELIDITHSPLWELSNLRRFSLAISDDEIPAHVVKEYISRMLDMLIHRCPNLQDLQLYQDHDADSEIDLRMIFEWGRWPLLKRLSLGDQSSPIIISEPSSQTITAAFFEAHPRLEHVHIPRPYGGSDLHLKGLPNLRAANVGDCQDIMTAVPLKDVTSHLEFLSGINIDVKSERGAELMEYLTQIPTLRRLVISSSIPSEDLMNYIVKAVPNIEMLHFGGYTPWAGITLMSAVDGSFDAHCDFLSRLRCLTHLSHFITITEKRNTPAFEPLIDLVMDRLGEASQSLQYLNLKVDYKYYWVTIKRDGRGAYAGWHFIETSAGIHVQDWGNFYFTEVAMNYLSDP